MIDISKWAFENKKLIYFLIAVLIVGGAYSSYEMSKLEDPEITVKLAMFGSLAASIMGGLLFGTLITLLFIPILYALFFHIKKTDK